MMFVMSKTQYKISEQKSVKWSLTIIFMYEDQIIFLLSETIRIIKDVVICIKQILPIYFFLSIRVYIKDRNKTVSDQNIYMKNIIRIDFGFLVCFFFLLFFFDYLAILDYFSFVLCFLKLCFWFYKIHYSILVVTSHLNWLNKSKYYNVFITCKHHNSTSVQNVFTSLTSKLNFVQINVVPWNNI